MAEKAENKVTSLRVVKDVTDQQLSVLSEDAIYLGCLCSNVWNQACIKTLIDIATLQLLKNIDKVVYKDLSASIKNGDKKYFKRTHSKLNQFFKSVVVKALKAVLERFDKVSVAVNVADTARIDSSLGLLLEKCHRNQFYQFWGGVFQVVHNAGRNVKVQEGDPDITLDIKHSKVLCVLTEHTVKYPVDVVWLGQPVLSFMKSTGSSQDDVKKIFFKVWTNFLLGALVTLGRYPDFLLEVVTVTSPLEQSLVCCDHA